MTRYHDQAYTLDPNVEIPDDAPQAVGHDEEGAEHVKERSDAFREDAQAAVEAQAQADQEWAERDPKPTPSELLAERGHEPAPDDASTSQGGDPDATDDSDEPQTESGGASDGPPDGTVQDVLDWVGDDPDRAQTALDAEQAGQNRATLIAELEKRTERTT